MVKIGYKKCNHKLDNTLYCGWCSKPVKEHTKEKLEEHHWLFNNMSIIWVGDCDWIGQT